MIFLFEIGQKNRSQLQARLTIKIGSVPKYQYISDAINNFDGASVAFQSNDRRHNWHHCYWKESFKTVDTLI